MGQSHWNVKKLGYHDEDIFDNRFEVDAVSAKTKFKKIDEYFYIRSYIYELTFNFDTLKLSIKVRSCSL